MIRPVLSDCLAPYLAASGTLMPELPPDIAIEDCAELLNAVMARLRLAIGARTGSAPEAPGQGLGGGVNASMLECVEALDTLHRTLKHDLGQRHRLEMELFDAETALAQARDELAVTRAGARPALRSSINVPAGGAGRGLVRSRVGHLLHQLAALSAVFSAARIPYLAHHINPLHARLRVSKTCVLKTEQVT
jgi:hypothetical protein